MNKKIFRKKMLTKRSTLTKKEVEKNSLNIYNNLINSDIYKNSSFIMSYVDFKNEVKTEKIIKYSLNIGKRIAVPICIPDKKELIVSELKDFDKELKKGNYNILEPKENYIRQIQPNLLDLILVPGVAFNKKGYRIGYGGGYYDRFFKKINKQTIKLGLAFNIQLVSKIPKETFDIPVDYIITENKLLKCKI